jgi:choline transporter-like protein 2/4/5
MALSFVYCLAYIYLLSAFAEPIAWAMIVLVQLGLIGGAGFGITQYLYIKASVGSSQNEGAFLAMGVVFSILAFCFAIAVYCGFNSLRIAINVIDASADFLAKTKRIIAVPIGYFFVTVIFIAVWLGCMICINSIGTITADTSLIIQGKDVNRTDAEDKVFMGLFLFMLFGIFWICAFIRAKTSFIVMVSASTYYFDSHKERDGEADVGLGFQLAYMKHAGSLALGSFIIALIQFIRVVVMTIAEQA